MPQAMYELHQHEDPAFPVIFHYDTVYEQQYDEIIHWHENPEFLYVTENNPQILINGVWHDTRPGDLIVINSGNLHDMRAKDKTASYYCLITDLSMLSALNAEQARFDTLIRDPEVSEWFARICDEHNNDALYCKEAMRTNIMGFLITLLRKHVVSNGESEEGYSNQMDMVKASIRLMQKRYAETVTLEDLARRTGFSRYYLCHVFHEITGCPPMQYLARYRCMQARNMITSGMDVSEAAINCGFDNLSYFSRTYRRYIGHLPSQDKR